MYILTIVLTVIISVLLIIVVLVQKSKGGGLSSPFAGSNQIMGVRRRTNDFIEKATWTLAGIICLLSILSVFVMPSVVTGARVKPTTEMQVVKGTETQAPAPAAATPAAPAAPAAEAPAAPAPAAPAPAAPAAN